MGRFARRCALLIVGIGFGLGLVPTAMAVVLPPEGIVLNRVHVRFGWEPQPEAVFIGLQVVPDDGSPDPFAAGVPVVDLVVGSLEDGTVVTSGLQFGESYAWRICPDVQPCGPTRRFEIAELPGSVPNFSVIRNPGDIEPGLTLFNLTSNNSAIPGGLAIVVDEFGDPVWFLATAQRNQDLRQLPSGRMLFNTRRDAGSDVQDDRGFEVTLNGQLAWASPRDPALTVHHEVFPMPNGNLLTLVYEVRDVLHEGELQPWAASRIVELDRWTNEVVWDWSPFDHFSTLDFDARSMMIENIGVGGSHLDQAYDWTHQNAVIYDPGERSVYTSSRQLSRITRIDYDTGAVVYNMGLALPSMPSGDVDFGDNLFSFQHAPQLLPNGNMMVYDNGNRRDHVNQTPTSAVTKAVELAFTGDPPSGASIVWEFTQPRNSLFVGDADRLPGGTTLVTAGTDATIFEVDEAGEIIWQLQAPEAQPYLIYRAERIPSLIVDVPLDRDGDGLVEDVDNCPDHANPGQQDCDGDGFGDVCAAALGLPVCPIPQCSDGIDNDGDGWIDHMGDPGCLDADDDSERGDHLPCDDGVDNDGDGWIDFPQDPGCYGPTDRIEDPMCQDGIDNDGDGLIDFDGGVSANGVGDVANRDPNCREFGWQDREKDYDTSSPPRSGCGLGAELALWMFSLWWWRSRSPM